MRLFLDASALAKRYIVEPGTDQVLVQCARASEILFSVLAPLELVAALSALRLRSRISLRRYHMLRRRLAADAEHATVVALTPSVLSWTRTCLETYGGRVCGAIMARASISTFVSVALKAASSFSVTTRAVPVSGPPKDGAETSVH